MTTEAADPYSLVLFTAQSGALSARLDHEDGSLLHLHSLVAPEKEALYFSDLHFWGDRVILAGCGLGYHLKRALEAVGDTTRILLIEYYDELADRCLERFPVDLREKVTVITRGRGGSTEKVARFLSGGAYVQVVKHPPSVRAHPDFFHEILQQCSGTPPVRRQADTVMFMQGDFFLERELAAAAAGEQVNAASFTYKKWESVTAYESEFQFLLQKTKPQMVLSINLLGVDANGILSEYCRRAGIPLVVWFVDDPRPILFNRKELVSEDVIVYTWERTYLSWLQRQGFGEVRYLPLATDPSQFPLKKVSDTTVDCGFVGTAMGNTFLNQIARKFLWKPEYADLAAVVARQFLAGARKSLDDLIADECRNRSITLPAGDLHTTTWLRSYIIHTASMLKRKSLISGLLPAGIETFGDPDGWRDLIGNELVTHENIDYRTGVADIYRSIAVTINSTSCQMPSALNQRVFDVPACGGFILNDDQPDLRELFSDNEYVTYSSVDECREKIAFYLKNDHARTTISVAARRKIIREHTYTHRLRSLLTL